MARNVAAQMISEMQEFAEFSAGEQRFICRSLDVASRGSEAASLWSRSPEETKSIEMQDRSYRRLLDLIRTHIPDDIGIDAAGEIIGPLITMSAVDLAEGKIESFSVYRFLYERLLGPSVRPWLPSAFGAAAALPYLHPDLRKTLLGSITPTDAARAGWSNAEPSFMPEWVDEVEVAIQ